MARVKLSPILSSISGSIGGITIQRNKFGITMRQKPLPFKFHTPAQYVVQQHMITIQKAWQDLTDAQRLQWNRYPDFSGQTINNDSNVKISGHALYLKYQLYRLLAGFSLLVTPAFVPMPAVPEIKSIQRYVGHYHLEFDSSVDHTSYFFLFSITTPRKLNQAFSKKGLRYMYVTPATAASFLFEDSYEAAFGILPATAPLVHITLQWFSVTAPVFTGVKTEVWQVTYS